MGDSRCCDLSVILPAYNAANFIESAIRSVLDQVPASRRVEIVVADDGSTDDTRRVVEDLGSDERIRYYAQENCGPSAARNLALRHARGSALMLLDADDSLNEDCLRTTLDFLDRYPEVGLFFTNYDIYDEHRIISASGVDIWTRFRHLTHREVDDDGWIFTESLAPHIVEGGAFMHTSGLTIRREVYDQVGPFQEGFSYGEDDEFFARATWATTAGYVDRVLSRKRNHAASLIHSPNNALRNVRHLLQLSEIQLEYYRNSEQMQRILRRKIRDCAASWCWQLIQAGSGSQARTVLWRYRAQYPWSGVFYRLLLRSFLPAKQG